MDPAAAKLIGAGLASIALVGAGIGIGTIFGNYLAGALRNPSAAPGQFANLLLGFALAEATGLFGLLQQPGFQRSINQIRHNRSGL